MNGKSYVAGLIIGAVASSVVTFLTTPKSGKETRIQLKNTVQPFIHGLSDLKSQLYELQKSVTSATIEGKETISSFLSDIKIVVRDWKNEILPHQLQLQEEIASLERTIEDIERSLSE